MLAALYQPVGGDFNVDGSVDAADYVVWRKTLGQSLGQSVDAYSAADGSGNGIIDQADHDIWRASFGYIGPPRPNIGFATFEATSGTQLVLEIVGSDLADTITVSDIKTPAGIHIHYENSAGADTNVDITSAQINAKVLETGLVFRGVYVRGIAGNDTSNLTNLGFFPAIVEAGSGDDQVTGGSQADLILGGRGSDTIAGGTGRDLIVGGRDGDALNGGPADDIVIGGEPTVDVATLDAAFTAWNAHSNYSNAVDAVHDVLVANVNVLEDQVVDTLTGGSNHDLFFAAVDTPSNNDSLTDFDSAQEQIEVTHPPIPASQLGGEAVEAVHEVGDSTIDFVRFAFPPALWNGSTPDAVTVEITLVEHRINGEAVHLQTLLLHLSATTLVTLNGGPGGTTLVDIDTTTEELLNESFLEVTTTLRGPGVLDGLTESFTTSVDLEPVQPS